MLLGPEGPVARHFGCGEKLGADVSLVFNAKLIDAERVGEVSPFTDCNPQELDTFRVLAMTATFRAVDPSNVVNSMPLGELVGRWQENTGASVHQLMGIGQIVVGVCENAEIPGAGKRFNEQLNTILQEDL